MFISCFFWHVMFLIRALMAFVYFAYTCDVFNFSPLVSSFVRRQIFCNLLPLYLLLLFSPILRIFGFGIGAFSWPWADVFFIWFRLWSLCWLLFFGHYYLVLILQHRFIFPPSPYIIKSYTLGLIFSARLLSRTQYLFYLFWLHSSLLFLYFVAACVIITALVRCFVFCIFHVIHNVYVASIFIPVCPLFLFVITFCSVLAYAHVLRASSVLSPSCCFLLLLLLLFSCYILLSPLLLSRLFCFLFSPSPTLFNYSSSVLRFWKRIRKVILKPRLPASLRTAKGTYPTLINTPPWAWLSP